MESDHPSTTFLKNLYKHCDKGFLNLRFLPSAKNFFLPLTEINNIPSLLKSHQDQNAYFGVATRENGNGTKKGIIEIPALWLDLDLKPSWRTKEDQSLSDIFINFPFEPTSIILSGGGVHAYWRLKEPIPFEEASGVEDLLKRLASYLDGDKSATDSSRILRIPGTFNFKYQPRREVSIWHLNDNEYNLSDFDLLPEVEIKTNSGIQTKSWERELLTGVPEGQRNTGIARLTGRYLSKGLSREEILPILIDVNSRNTPPLSEREVESTLDSIINTHQRNLPEKLEDKQDRKGRNIAYKLTTMDEVLEYSKPEYLIDPILIEGTVSVLGAYTGTGKSILALSIMKSILTRELLWGKFKVLKTGPVLLIDEETPKGFLRERTQKMGFARGLPLYLLHFQEVRLDRDDYFSALMEKVEEVKPILVVIDSLIRVHRLKEDDAISMSLVVGRLRKIANNGTTVLVIHHHKKGDSPLSQKLRGSSDIPGGVDLEYALLPGSDHLVFKSVKTRVQPLTPVKLKMEVSHDHIGLVYQGEEYGEEEEILSEIVCLLEEESELDVEKLFKGLRDRGLKVGINRLREILKKGSQKELTEERGPKGKKVYKLSPA